MNSEFKTINATLCFIISGNRILLIMKKRGMGEGKYNGPGGKIDLNEKIEDAAIRETLEETGLEPSNLMKKGILYFYFGDSAIPKWKVHVFVASTFSGTIVESEEARPEWFPIKNIPYDLMWEDDRYWLPKVLDGSNLFGTFKFSSDMQKLLDFQIEELDQNYFAS